MAVTSGFFNSVEGDRTYDADQMSTYFEGLISDGIYENLGDAFIVRATGNGLDISVGSGRALVKTHWIKNDAAMTITLSPANVQYSRRDSIFIRYNATERTVSVVVVEGTPSPTYNEPQPVHSENIYDLFVASVIVSRNATVLTQSMIHDYRGSSVCPWITGVIEQVDTSKLFLQYQTAYREQFAAFDQYLAQKQAEFNTWFSHLTGQLQVDTTLHEYQDSYTITSEQQSSKLYPFTLENYEADSDILFVIVDGIILTENVDFKIIKFDEHFPDINGDGRVTDADYSMIVEAIQNVSGGQPSGLTPTQEKSADTDYNGRLTNNDATRALRFITEVSNGNYTNNLSGWRQFIGDLYNTTIDSEYYVVPLKSTYRAGSQMTLRIIKSVIGEGSSGSRPSNVTQLALGTFVMGTTGNITQPE